MSKISEMVDEEATRAEAESPEEEEATEEEEQTPPEPPEEPEAPAGPTEEQMAALDKEDKRHEKALANLMGADFSYFGRCGQCDGLGYFMPAPPTEVRYQQHPHTFKCPTCEGMGDVASGAVGRNQLVQCPDCGGKGYKEHQQAAAPVAPSPVMPSGDEAAAQRLKDQGWTVVPPYVPPAPTSGNANLAVS